MAGQSSDSSEDDQVVNLTTSGTSGTGPPHSVIPTVVVAEAARMTTSRRSGKRGRKPAKIDVKAKLERSRQSARECRARKKLRYQYLEELVSSRERAIYSLRRELEQYKQWSSQLDRGKISPELYQKLQLEQQRGLFDDASTVPRTTHWCHIVSDSSGDESDDSDTFIKDESSRVMTRLATNTPKGKGQGKGVKHSATKRHSEEYVVSSTSGAQSESVLDSYNIGATVAPSTDSVSLDLEQAQEIGEPSRLMDDMNLPGATSSPYALDTLAVDHVDTTWNQQKTNKRVMDITNIPESVKLKLQQSFKQNSNFKDVPSQNPVYKAPVKRNLLIQESAKRIPPTATITIPSQFYSTINTSDLYTPSFTQTPAPPLEQPMVSEAPPSELPGQLDLLSDQDVVELLQIIEKDQS